jgi:T5SS/PEP-CTERM-associated repeat protein
MGVATVSGSGSQWIVGKGLTVGFEGTGNLNVDAGGVVSSPYSPIGNRTGSSGIASVSGGDSKWTTGILLVGRDGSGQLNITGGGLVSVDTTLTIDYDTNGDSFINMSTGGMLALFGEAEDTLAQFMDLIDGTDAIRYWDEGGNAWANITSATYGDDYTLSYLTTGDLTGYTLLTVTTPAWPDLNLDGTVDGLDLGMQLLNWGQNVSPDQGELDGSPPVNGADLGILLGAWTGSPPLSAASVPEPTGFAIVAVGLFGGLRCRRREA